MAILLLLSKIHGLWLCLHGGKDARGSGSGAGVRVWDVDLGFSWERTSPWYLRVEHCRHGRLGPAEIVARVGEGRDNKKRRFCDGQRYGLVAAAQRWVDRWCQSLSRAGSDKRGAPQGRAVR